jgi:hypothetical protein
MLELVSGERGILASASGHNDVERAIAATMSITELVQLFFPLLPVDDVILFVSPPARRTDTLRVEHRSRSLIRNDAVFAKDDLIRELLQLFV